MRLHRTLSPWLIGLLPLETVFSSVTDVSRGIFPVLNIHGYTSRRSDEAPMPFNVVTLERGSDARGTRVNHDMIKFPSNDLRDISFYLGNLRNV